MKTKYDSLLANHEGCGKRLDDLRKQFDDFVQENTSLKEEIGRLNSRLDKDTSDFASLERKEHQQINDEEKRKREKIRELAEEQRERNEAARNKALKEAEDAMEVLIPFVFILLPYFIRFIHDGIFVCFVLSRLLKGFKKHGTEKGLKQKLLLLWKLKRNHLR